MKLDGTEAQSITKGNLQILGVTDNFLLYRQITEGDGYFKCSLDGQNVEKW